MESRINIYDEICQQYILYVASHYGRPVVVLNGYLDGPSTKDVTQRRRAGTRVGATVQLSGSMVLKGRKEHFLHNKDNKQRCIALLSDHLERHGCVAEHARADADLLIEQTDIAAAERTTKPTILVADDADVLILPCCHSKSTTQNIYFRPEPRQRDEKGT